jgi:hypothetical protein
MAGVPAHCPHCGRVFVSAAFNFGFASTVVLENNRTNCPFCGQTAQIIDGTFNFLGNAILVRDAPPRTIAILQTLQNALAASQKGEADAKVLDKIKDASPELADQIQKATVASGKPLVGLLLLLLAGNCSMATNTSLNWNQLVDQVRVYATGASPYPELGNTVEKPKMNRQQRRSQERQTKKQKPQPERPPPKKPAR